MYLEHFGINEPPFRITPHTEFFFAGANRGTTLDALVYAITHDEGIVKVSGEVGSGKTMLCRVLMERLPEDVVIVYLANPSLSREDMVFAIADELELVIPEGTRASAAVRMLQAKLIELHGDGRQVVVLIDEAHAMPLETLEEIRLLSNLETSQHKLLQLVLFGQPELDQILTRPDMRQLKERITHNFQLEPLHRDDIARYIDFRMRTAGYRGPEVFSQNAIKLIAGASQGLTRRVNILAEKSLLAAYAEGIHQVTPKQVDAAIRDSQYEKPGMAVRHRLMLLAGTVLFVVLAFFALKEELPDQAPAKGGEAAPPIKSAETLPAAVPASTATVETVKDDPVPSTAAATDAPARASGLPTLDAAMESRLQETRQWIATADGNRWFIQLTTTGASETVFVRLFLDKADKLLHPERAGMYVAGGPEQPRFGIIYGDYPSSREAKQAIDRLPQELRTYKPFPRQIMWLK